MWAVFGYNTLKIRYPYVYRKCVLCVQFSKRICKEFDKIFALSSLYIFVVWTLFSIIHSPFVLFRHLFSLACSVGIVVKRAEILQGGAVAEVILILYKIYKI